MDQEILEANPESYPDYLKQIQREQQLAAPQTQDEGDQWARMEANMTALIDRDPELMKAIDMERMKASMGFVDKVKVCHFCDIYPQYLTCSTETLRVQSWSIR